MTTISLLNAGARPQHPDIAHRLQSRIAAISLRRRQRRELQGLARLPRHLLRDMGLEHCAPDRTADVIAFWR